MRCDDIEEYLDGALTGSRLAMFEEHLKDCPACTRERRHQERLDRALSTVARSLPPAPTRVRSRIGRDVKALESRQRALTRWKFAAAVLIAGVGIALGLGPGLGLRFGDDDRPREQATPAPEVEIAGSPSVVELIPEANPVATVVIGDSASTLAIPVTTNNVNATIVFVYPVFDGGKIHDRIE